MSRRSFRHHAALASRKDARNAVRAARAAHAGWAARSGYQRGQLLYRIAELLQGRRHQLAGDLEALGSSPGEARTKIDGAIASWVWYAGWADKYAQVLGNPNPVAGPFASVSVPEPVGVVATLAPPDHALAGLVAAVAPALATGNTVVALASFAAPLPAATLAEVLATSDVPPGVVNILTGEPRDIVGWLASHADVDALDLSGAAALDRAALEAAAAETLTTVVRPAQDPTARSLARLAALTETKTVWQTSSEL
ncbi:MAG TPA: aldehyde dehydrogenase family protein [Actinomycetaceae bacterium]|nr:aldehyde dehydrogenase family protein [Actinomycetaceae bacterium]